MLFGWLFLSFFTYYEHSSINSYAPTLLSFLIALIIHGTNIIHVIVNCFQIINLLLSIHGEKK